MAISLPSTLYIYNWDAYEIKLEGVHQVTNPDQTGFDWYAGRIVSQDPRVYASKVGGWLAFSPREEPHSSDERMCSWATLRLIDSYDGDSPVFGDWLSKGDVEWVPDSS